MRTAAMDAGKATASTPPKRGQLETEGSLPLYNPHRQKGLAGVGLCGDVSFHHGSQQSADVLATVTKQENKSQTDAGGDIKSALLSDGTP